MSDGDDSDGCGLTYEITSTSNPRMRELVALRDRRERDTSGRFVVEGERLMNRAIASGREPLVVYTDGSRPVDPSWHLITVSPEVLDRVSYRERSEGVIAVFSQWSTDLDRLMSREIHFALVAEAVEKPGNLGALLRTADGAGVDAVIVIGDGVDLFNPNVLRSSTGAVFTLPSVIATHSETRELLTGRELRLVAADPNGTETMWDTDLTQPVAVMVGAEDVGLSQDALAIADTTVSIPMAGSVDSLNVSVAASLLVYESLRQTRGSGVPGD